MGQGGGHEPGSIGPFPFDLFYRKHRKPTFARMNESYTSDRQIMSIGTKRYHSAARKLLYITIFNALLGDHSVVSAAEPHGTLIIVGRDDDFVVAAADSRETDVQGGAHQHPVCKIIAFDDHGFFALSGVPRAFGIDAIDEAKHWYIPSTSLADIAVSWAADLEDKYLSLTFAQQQAVIAGAMSQNSSIIDTGIFAADVKGKIDAVAIEVRFRQTPPIISFFNGSPFTLPDGARIMSGSDIGRSRAIDLLRESGPWKTELMSEIERQHYSRPDSEAFQIKSSIEEVVKENIDSNVGGAVAAIVLERGHSLRWFSETAECPGHSPR